jgi:hypothetical protein
VGAAFLGTVGLIYLFGFDGWISIEDGEMRHGRIRMESDPAR